MPAGTIALTNGSTAVTGSGTSFATELKVNDFVVAVVGGVTYTLGVQAIGSATALTLTTAYNGPTTSGLAWTAVPNAALVGITAQVAADVAKAIRGFNFDKVNWQKIFSSDNSVTVTMPDLTQFTGPSWGYLATQLSTALKVRGQIPSAGIDFNTYGPTADFEGVWYLSSGSQASGSTNIPEANIGVLEVFRGGAYQGSQRYTTRYGVVYSRNLTATWTAASPNVWGPWISAGNGVSGVFYSGDANSLTTPGQYGVTAAATNIPVAVTGRMLVETRTPTPTSTFGAITQTFSTFSTAAANRDRIFRRSFDGNSTWTSWVEYLSTNSFGTAAGTAAQGNDSRIVNALNKTGDTVTGILNLNHTGFGLVKPSTAYDTNTKANYIFQVQLNDTRYVVNSDLYYSGQYVTYRLYTGDPNNGTKVWEFRTDGTFRSPGSVYANGSALTSDKRLKSNFEEVKISIDDIDLIQPETYDKVSPDDSGDVTHEMGIVAQKIEGVIPDLVSKFYWNEEYPDLRMVNYSGLTSWLVGYCKVLKDRIASQDEIIAELQKRMKAIDGLDA